MSDEEFIPVPRRAPEDKRTRAIRLLADAVHQANEMIRRAVDTGLSVELIRVSRYHDGRGNWGDQMIPTVREDKDAPLHDDGAPSSTS